MTPSARHAFLDRLVDDAGLFPPARLSMADALEAGKVARASAAPWMIGRFVVPASRIDELRHALEARGESVAASVVVDGTGPIGETLELLAIAARASAHVVALESLECPIARVAGADDMARVAEFEAAFAAAKFAFAPAVYLELPLGETVMEAAVAAVVAARARGFGIFAKIRCGGLEAAAIPPAERVAAFLRLASDVSLPFKATAGLHHPLTRLDAGLGAVMHGFLNVCGAAIFAHALNAGRETLAAMLRDGDAANFRLDDEAFGWRVTAIGANDIASARATFVHSYGSCSLAEPVHDLRALGMLENVPA